VRLREPPTPASGQCPPVYALSLTVLLLPDQFRTDFDFGVLHWDALDLPLLHLVYLVCPSSTYAHLPSGAGR